jgi:kojibiose phosphorylase
VGEAGGATEAERDAFARAAELLPIPYAEDGLLCLQCEEFEQWAEPRFEQFWNNRSQSFAGQVSQERLYRSKCLKQADVLMLMMLFCQEFSDEQVRRAWDHYVPYATHDSSLSSGVHAVVAARLGLMDEAWRFWEMGQGLDLDVEHGGASEGIHMANAGAVWQMAVFGFAGVRTAMQADELTLSPRLPPEWSRLAFHLIWKGTPVWIDIERNRVSIANRSRVDELTFWLHDQQRSLAPEEMGRWPIRA